MPSRPEPDEPRAPRVPAAVVWMLVTTFFFVCVHATGKYLVASHPVVQVVWGRYVFHLLFAAAILGPRLTRVARTANLRLQLLRSLFMLGASGFYFAGVRTLPLAEANAIAFTTPILVVLLAQPVLGERVGPRRWLGVAGGFLGALIVIRPGSGVMDLAAGFLLASAFCNACYHIATRQIGARDDPLTTLFYAAVVGTAGASAALPVVWQPLDAEAWLLLAVLGGVACAGHFTIIKAYQAAPASVVAPFNYAILIWTVVFGYVIFGDLPGPWTLLGAAVIVLSGLYILRRERGAKPPDPLP
ncbi:MAG: DMT family transporter [Rhodospirillales bacterium]|nr:DMT family transporter [Rhodospirillales bacterium]MDH3920994.1 DMT family transporter [Rhodospirillales bacterium]MDH3969208.1 DMT family transporter [Rhodospirillales bacterium]